MTTFPSLPFFTDAYLADAGHLSDAEHGRYLLLLMHMWRAPGCRLPNDNEWLARKLGRSVQAIENEILPIVREFCHVAGPWIYQKRLLKEYEYCRKVSKKNSANAKSRWNKEKGVSDRICEPDATSHEFGNAPNPNPNPTIKKEEDGANAPPPAVGSVDTGSPLPSANTAAPRAYAFEAGIIRLVEKDLTAWVKAFTHLDVRAELIGCADWAEKQGPRWFHAVKNMLVKRNREAKAAAAGAAMKAAAGGVQMVMGVKGELVPKGSFWDPKAGITHG